MLAQQQIEEFEQNGYLVVNELISKDRILAPLIDEYTDRLRMLCKRWVVDKKLPIDASLGDLNYMIKACADARIDYTQPLNIALPLDAVQPHTPFHAGPAVFDLITHSKLLNAIQSLIGSEITANPNQRITIKPPLTSITNPDMQPHITPSLWQQNGDSSVDGSDNTRVISAWIAVTDANEKNGCLRVMPGSHTMRSDPSNPVPPFDENEALALPVPAGGGVLFHPNTIHGSLSNHSNDVGWSFDLCYNITGETHGPLGFPSFIARSEANPDSVLRSAHAWRQLWEDARKQLSDDSSVRIQYREKTKDDEACV